MHLKKKKKNQLQKSFIFQQLMAKKVRNLMIFGEIIMYLRKQLQKITHFKKFTENKSSIKIGAYLCSQFK